MSCAITATDLLPFSFVVVVHPSFLLFFLLLSPLPSPSLCLLSPEEMYQEKMFMK